MTNPIEEARKAIEEARYADAAALLEPLTNADDAEADYLFGCLLFDAPDIVSRDEAMDALQRAADLDHPAACFRVATTAFDGDGIQTGVVEDPELLVHAAELGDVEAQRMVGLLHVEGQEGFPEDPEETRYWYERAAEQGEPESQYDLSRMMLEGEGGEFDPEGALKWLAACANQDAPVSEQAADFLACLYEEGRYDIEPSEIEAAHWRSRQQALDEAAERARIEHEATLAEVAAGASEETRDEDEGDEDERDNEHDGEHDGERDRERDGEPDDQEGEDARGRS